ncbi:hypothetical protein HAX54_045481 [Datura stramonium]|uniref:Uncharacterized protein n=1 Tax=Datura stramonium TaxID=4076 RepID=A0ABS8Y6I5_DATST|nr:hypothetical protein [Datura stramonium]
MMGGDDDHGCRRWSSGERENWVSTFLWNHSGRRPFDGQQIGDGEKKRGENDYVAVVIRLSAFLSNGRRSRVFRWYAREKKGMRRREFEGESLAAGGEGKNVSSCGRRLFSSPVVDNGEDKKRVKKRRWQSGRREKMEK